jgi:hypothetical protein
MMKNFQLLEDEHDHSGGRNGPLAVFTETFNGHEYYHLRRMYRGAGDMWCPSKQGISCPAEQREALLAALSVIAGLPPLPAAKPAKIKAVK